MVEWQSESIPLPARHGWDAAPDHVLVVVDRGAATFELPRSWTAAPTEEGSLRAHDRPPPDDESRIEVSLIRVPLGPVRPPLGELLAAIAGEELGVLEQRPPDQARRDDTELAWVETVHRDSGRRALARACVAHGRGTTVFLTMDLWEADAERFDGVWQHLLATLKVGRQLDLTGCHARRN